MPNVIYEKLRAVTDELGLTSEQVAVATKVQAAAMMNVDAGCVDDKVFEVAKNALLAELERAKWQKVLSDLKAQLIGGNRVWLRENFPDAEFKIDHRRKVVAIYLEGIPVMEDID